MGECSQMGSQNTEIFHKTAIVERQYKKLLQLGQVGGSWIIGDDLTFCGF